MVLDRPNKAGCTPRVHHHPLPAIPGAEYSDSLRDFHRDRSLVQRSEDEHDQEVDPLRAHLHFSVHPYHCVLDSALRRADRALQYDPVRCVQHKSGRILERHRVRIWNSEYSTEVCHNCCFRCLMHGLLTFPLLVSSFQSRRIRVAHLSDRCGHAHQCRHNEGREGHPPAAGAVERTDVAVREEHQAAFSPSSASGLSPSVCSATFSGTLANCQCLAEGKLRGVSDRTIGGGKLHPPDRRSDPFPIA